MELDKLEVIQSVKTKDALIEVLAYPKLEGASAAETASSLFFVKESGMRLKMVKITLTNSSVRIEPGAVYFMKGNLEVKATTGGGVAKALLRKAITRETFFVTEVQGTGEIYLEPTFGHFLLHEVSKADEGLIVDKSLFYAGTAGLDISAKMQKNVSSALFGGEGLFQTSISGEGIAVIFSPVPSSEVIDIALNGDKLFVDGNFALMRTENIEFRVEMSSKSLLSTSVTGEMLFQTFRGTGHVWVAPTQEVYEKLAGLGNPFSFSKSPGSQGTKVK